MVVVSNVPHLVFTENKRFERSWGSLKEFLENLWLKVTIAGSEDAT